jgi:hypothetical protein
MNANASTASQQSAGRPTSRRPVSLPPEEVERLRGAGWTPQQLAAGKRQVAQPCRRCGGSGHLRGFRRVDGGRCLRCHAIGTDPKPATEYAPSVRAKLDERAARRRDARQANHHEMFDGWLGQRPELAAALQRADADLRAWQAWDGHQDPASKPHTPLAWDPFLAELTRQLRRWEPLSDRQVEFYVRRVAAVSSHDEPERHRQARQVPAPEGTVSFAGTVATVRSQPGYMGRVELKMLVIAEAADGGEFRVWCTVPQRGGPCRQGDRIMLTVELRRCERDPSFAFGKHPRLGAPAGSAVRAVSPRTPRGAGR